MAASLEAHQAQRDTMTARLHEDHGISYHRGTGAVSGHYCTAIQDGDTWRVLEDGLDTEEGTFLPWIALEEAGPGLALVAWGGSSCHQPPGGHLHLVFQAGGLLIMRGRWLWKPH